MATNIIMASLLLISSGSIDSAVKIEKNSSGCRIFQNSIAIYLDHPDVSVEGLYFIGFDEKAVLFHMDEPYYAKRYKELDSLVVAGDVVEISYRNNGNNSVYRIRIEGVDERCSSRALHYYESQRG